MGLSVCKALHLIMIIIIVHKIKNDNTEDVVCLNVKMNGPPLNHWFLSIISFGTFDIMHVKNTSPLSS